MIKTTKYFKNHRTLYFAIGSTLVMLLYTKFILGHFSRCFTLDVGTNSLGLSFYYTLDTVQNFFESRNRIQLICYNQFLQIWDIIFAFFYAIMYASWILCLFKTKRLFFIVPILAMIFDWVENYVELLMLETYLNSNLVSGKMVSLGSGINSIKWSLIILTYLIILIGIMGALRIFFKKT